MSSERKIARVVRKIRLAELDEARESRAFWADRPLAEKFAELESLRRMWTKLTGDPDQPTVRVVHRRRLGEPAIERPAS